MNDGRALTEREIEKIKFNFYGAVYNDHEIERLFQTIAIQRQVLRQLFNYFMREPLRRVSTAEPVRNSDLDHLKELVSMEDR